MTSSRPDVAAIAAALLRPIRNGDDLRAIEALCVAVRDRTGHGAGRTAGDLDHLAGCADPVLLRSAQAMVSGEVGYYADLLSHLERHMASFSLEALYQIHCGIGRQFFLGRMACPPAFLSDRIFPFYSRFLDELRTRLAIVGRRRPAGGGMTGRLALITNQFLSPRHQPSRDLLSYAAVLEDRCGRDVVILNTNMMPPDIHCLFVPPFAATIEPAFDGKQVVEVEGRSYRMLSSVDPRLSADKIDWFLRAVAWHDPDVVVSLGGSVVIADLLAGTRPTLSIPTTSGATVSLADIVLDFGGGTVPGGGPLAASWRPFRFLHSLRQGPASPSSRSDFGVPADGFLCVVIGNRLDEEVDGAFLAMLESVLDQVPRSLVLFAGAGTSLGPRLAGSRHGNRLRHLGYVEPVGALLAIADTYINPHRTGGAASAAEALAAGVVPVSLSGGDVASVVGPSFIVSDYGAMTARLVHLASDASARRAAAEGAKRTAAARATAASAAADLSRYLDEAVLRFHNRAGVDTGGP